jgi:hypothetical protein
LLKKILSASLVVAGLMTGAAHAAPIACSMAGQYDGKYEGPDDHGFVRVNVALDGTVTGEAQSQQADATFAIGGVVHSDGTLATNGAVSSGAQFNGRFVGNVAAGTWRNLVSINGTPRTLTGSWGVQRTAAADGCE